MPNKVVQHAIDFGMNHRLNKDLPKLAWLAEIVCSEHQVSLVHGSSVECTDKWAVEGVWDGPFMKGEFYRSEAFFGSGIRLVESTVYCVASSALVDRLLYYTGPDSVVVSNSLLVMLAFMGARLDPNHDYHRECQATLDGVDRYDPEFAIIHDQVRCIQQLFFKNLVVSAHGISFERRDTPRALRTFDDYYGTLKEILLRIKNNCEDTGRKHQITPLSTLSSGYDSTAVSALAAMVGVKKCFGAEGSFDPAIKALCDKPLIKENASKIAQRLGLEFHCLDGSRSHISEDEIYFIASICANGRFNESEIIFHSMTDYIQKNCDIAVVYTGYHGDKVWNVNLPEDYQNDQIKRGDPSGLWLTEIRLKAGFVNLAVPFILARNVKSIVSISKGKDMVPWSIGGGYDRPIPRRIVEEAGVDRRMFGIRKAVVAVADKYWWPINTRLRKQFYYYLRKNYGIGVIQLYAEYAMYLRGVRKLTIQLAGGIEELNRRPVEYKYFFLKNGLDLNFLMYLWATETLAGKLARILDKSRNK
jgi:hypothetical protein